MTHWRTNTNVQANLGGGEHLPARYGLRSTRADMKFDEREIAVWVFAALCAVSPLAVFVLYLSVIRFFS